VDGQRRHAANGTDTRNERVAQRDPDEPAGVSTFTVTATDASSSITTQTLTLTLNAALALTTSSGLAFSGGDSITIAVCGLIILAAGVALLAGTCRRRRAYHG
jgi:hypothetical protein